MTAADDLLLYGHALAFVAYALFGLWVLGSGRLRGARPRTRGLLLAAVAGSALWSLAQVGLSRGHALAPAALVPLLELARYGLWFGFLVALTTPEAAPGTGPDGAAPGPRTLHRLAWATLGLALLLWGAAGFAPEMAGVARARLMVALALPVLGLLLVEQLYRNLHESLRWNAKPTCLGLALVFGFDVYVYAEALLFGRFDEDALRVRGLVHALLVPFLVVAVRRSAEWVGRLQVSRAAAFYSVTLILAGLYLLFMAAVGYYVRLFGGSWGRALQTGLLVAGLAGLLTLAFSGTARSRLRVFVGKHFYSYRYDYREQWLRFTALLGTKSTPQAMGELIVSGLARMVECPSGSLFTRGEGRGGEPVFVQSARWNAGRIEDTEPAEASLARFLQEKGWVVDLEQFRAQPRHYEGLALPTWLLGMPNAWLVVPLLSGDELQGFVVLARPLAAQQLNWELLDLLKTAGRQAAGHLAQMQATEALLEARKFEAFNRMSAFVVHDLKNIVAQLSLMLKNAERLHDNREFQQDMLLTVESSLEKMKRLMLQLREGATPPGGSRGVELAPIVRRLQQMVQAQGRRLDVDNALALSTRGHEERLERVLGHLVQNALDATPPDGRVWLKVARHSGQVQVEVGDTGAGMSEDFVRDRLFRPFHTTKHSGMGIGTHESQQYIRELGGSIEVSSRLGEGTVMRVRLPLFEVQRGSDLLPQG